MSRGGCTLASEYPPRCLGAARFANGACELELLLPDGLFCHLQAKLCLGRSEEGKTALQHRPSWPKQSHSHTMGQRSPAIPHIVNPSDGEARLTTGSFNHQGLERDTGTSITVASCCTGFPGKDRVPQHPLCPWGPVKPHQCCGTLGSQGAAGDVCLAGSPHTTLHQLGPAAWAPMGNPSAEHATGH